MASCQPRRSLENQLRVIGLIVISIVCTREINKRDGLVAISRMCACQIFKRESRLVSSEGCRKPVQSDGLIAINILFSNLKENVVLSAKEDIENQLRVTS